jgi:hypothetical protein
LHHDRRAFFTSALATASLVALLATPYRGVAMLGGNGNFGRNLPEQLDAALRAARAGHHVSFEALRGAVCVYIDELIVAGLDDAEIRERVVAAFQEVSDDAHDAPAGWNEDLVDELIGRCRERGL